MRHSILQKNINMKRVFSLICLIGALTSFAQDQIELYPARSGGEKDSYGLIDKTGKLIIDYQYDAIYRDNQTGNFRVYKGKNAGLLSVDGEEVLPTVYSKVNCLGDNEFLVQKEDKTFYISADGQEKEIKNGIFDQYYMKNLFPVMVNDKIGYVDANGKIIIPAEYDVTWTRRGFEGGFVILQKGKNTYIFSEDGSILLETDKEIDVKWNGQGLLRFKENRKWGYMTMDGKVIVEPKYRAVYEFKDGFGKISKDDYEPIYVDVNGKTYSQDEYGKAQARPFWAKYNHSSYEYALIRKDGKPVLPYDYSNITICDNGMMLFKKRKSRDIELRSAKVKRLRVLENVWYLESYEGGLLLVHHNDLNDDTNTKMYDAYYNEAGEMVWKGDIYVPECFPEDAMISMADGSHKQISLVVPGDLVYAFDFVNNKILATTVEETFEYTGKRDINSIMLSRGDASLVDIGNSTASTSVILEITSSHKIVTKAGPKTVGDLNSTDQFNCIIDGETYTANMDSKRMHTREVSKVYNLKTEQGNFFVNSVLVLVK